MEDDKPPSKTMVVRKPAYKKWWLDFQGNGRFSRTEHFCYRIPEPSNSTKSVIGKSSNNSHQACGIWFGLWFEMGPWMDERHLGLFRGPVTGPDRTLTELLGPWVIEAVARWRCRCFFWGLALFVYGRSFQIRNKFVSKLARSWRSYFLLGFGLVWLVWVWWQISLPLYQMNNDTI